VTVQVRELEQLLGTLAEVERSEARDYSSFSVRGKRFGYFWPRTRTVGLKQTVSEQPLLVVWEVLGHLDLLLDAGRVHEHVTEDGSTYGVASFALAGTH